MQVDPQRVADHLTRLYMPGGPENAQVRHVVLRGHFECAAKSADGSLVVTIPPLADVPSLPEEVGIDLRSLIGSLRLCREWGVTGRTVSCKTLLGRRLLSG